MVGILVGVLVEVEIGAGTGVGAAGAALVEVEVGPVGPAATVAAPGGMERMAAMVDGAAAVGTEVGLMWHWSHLCYCPHLMVTREAAREAAATVVVELVGVPGEEVTVLMAPMQDCEEETRVVVLVETLAESLVGTRVERRVRGAAKLAVARAIVVMAKAASLVGSELQQCNW